MHGEIAMLHALQHWPSLPPYYLASPCALFDTKRGMATVDGKRRTHQLMAAEGLLLIAPCGPHKQPIGFLSFVGCLGALATWVVPLTFDNNVDVASYYTYLLPLILISRGDFLTKPSYAIYTYY